MINMKVLSTAAALALALPLAVAPTVSFAQSAAVSYTHLTLPTNREV